MLGKHNHWTHFARTVHSHHPLPGRSHLQRTPQRRSDSFCCVTLLAIEWSLLQRTRYNVFSVGKKTPKTATSAWDFVTLQEEDRATAIGNTHRKNGKDRACDSGDILADRQIYRQTHTHIQTYSSQYFAVAPVGEVKKLTIISSSLSTTQKLGCWIKLNDVVLCLLGRGYQ